MAKLKDKIGSLFNAEKQKIELKQKIALGIFQKINQIQKNKEIKEMKLKCQHDHYDLPVNSYPSDSSCE